MNITIISSLPPIKGISKYTSALLQGIPTDQHIEVLNFKQMYPEKLYPGGIRDNSLKPVNLSNVQVRTFLTWYNPLGWLYAGLSAKGDIIHAQWWSYVLAPLYLTILVLTKFIRRKKIVLTVHNVKPHEEGLLKNLANNSVYKLADRFIVHSEDNKRVFSKDHNIPENKISVIPHGILLPDAPMTDITKAEARKKLQISNDAKVVLFFGIIREYKGLDTLLEAVAIVKNQIPNVYLIIAGKPWEHWEKYERLIKKHELRGIVHKALKFIPENEIEKYFKAADVVALPYRHFDSQSGAGSLALPFGKAVVVTNAGGLPQLVKDDRTICAPDDSSALSERLIQVLSDRQLRHKLENDSLMLAKALSWEAIGKQTIKIYEEALRE